LRVILYRMGRGDIEGRGLRTVLNEIFGSKREGVTG
jgi:hypothetical protein